MASLKFGEVYRRVEQPELKQCVKFHAYLTSIHLQPGPDWKYFKMSMGRFITVYLSYLVLYQSISKDY